MELVYAVVELDATTRSIIEHFNRSCPWTHVSGGYRAGMRSWVDSTGAELFELGLRNLSVSDELGEQEADAAWLSLVHRVATAAVEAKMGLLWGVDLACVYARAGSALYPAGPRTFSL